MNVYHEHGINVLALVLSNNERVRMSFCAFAYVMSAYPTQDREGTGERGDRMYRSHQGSP